jgi:hypothetical protein
MDERAEAAADDGGEPEEPQLFEGPVALRKSTTPALTRSSGVDSRLHPGSGRASGFEFGVEAVLAT